MGEVAAVNASPVHGFSKQGRESIRLLAGLGVEGDAHAGESTRHRYLVKKDPGRRNLTQVHLIHAELFEELARAGFTVVAGEMGENVTTRGVDLLGLPVGARVCLGRTAVVEVTGLREPCSQLNKLRPGLMKAVLGWDAAGKVVRKAGIMGVVLAGGEVWAGDQVRVEMTAEPWVVMGPV